MSNLLKSAETLNAMFWPRACAVLDSIDINPLLVLPEGEGTVALDGLIATKE